MPVMLSSLKNQSEFDQVSKHGTKSFSPNFICVYTKSFPSVLTTSNQHIFLGMKVGRRIGNAVIRSKIKRRIRHLVRILAADPGLQISNWGLIIIPKKGFEKADFQLLQSELHKSLLGRRSKLKV